MDPTTLCGIYFQSVRLTLISSNQRTGVRESVEKRVLLAFLHIHLRC